MVMGSTMKMDGKLFHRVTEPDRKAYASGIAGQYRSGKKKYKGRKAAGVRVVKSPTWGYAVFVR